MQPVIPAPFPFRRRVGDVPAAVRPADVIALTAHQRDELLPAAGVPHTFVNGVHQAELPALPSGGGMVLRTGQGFDRLLFLRLEYRKTQLCADLIVPPAQLGQFRFADVQFLPVLEADAVD